MAKRKRHRAKINNEALYTYPPLSHSSHEPINKVQQSLLSQFYPEVLTLRSYLLSKLPKGSIIRRKKVASAGRQGPKSVLGNIENSRVEADVLLGSFLDSTLVGLSRQNPLSDHRATRWRSFTSQADASELEPSGTPLDQGNAQSEIVDFAVWLLFNKSTGAMSAIKHILCQGFSKVPSLARMGRMDSENVTLSATHRLTPAYHNKHYNALKADPWPQILGLLGKGGDCVMIDLLLDCGIFLSIPNSRGNYYQISGEPLGDLRVLRKNEHQDLGDATARHRRSPLMPPMDRSPSSIVFQRNKILYARPTLNSRGSVTFGLRHIHALNRYPYSSNKSGKHINYSTDLRQRTQAVHPSTLQVLKYIFPKQFGLHNVFNSTVDTRETVQTFKDYTLREDEIRSLPPNHKAASSTKIPKQLRGLLIRLVQKLQILHRRCPYGELVKYYCPSKVFDTVQVSHPPPITDNTSCNFQTQKSTQASHCRYDSIQTSPPNTIKKDSVIGLACASENVSAFCRAVLNRVIPDEFWGTGEDQTHNKEMLMKSVDRFVKLRRYETISLHDVMQGMKTSAIPWLSQNNSERLKWSQSETRKRQEIFQEFMYYIFDSFIIPLIRCNFHATESGIHRYRIFFFRQDVWRNLSEPAIASLKIEMFEEVDIKLAKTVLDSRSLGFSQIRLLPKEKGVRPILNLRRRQVRRDSKRSLGPSINSVLAPVYNMLTFEKNRSPAKFGSTLFSVGDLYTKIKDFVGIIEPENNSLYFCKVDVQSAFDTIPQTTIINLVSELPKSDEYQISKHVEVKPGDGHRLDTANHERSKPIRKWTSLAWATNRGEPFDFKLCQKMANGKNTIFTENLAVQNHNKAQLVALLSEHIQRNLIKIGKKFYRQKKGIPQGSVLSSLLCNYFYADLEMKHLSFLNSNSSLLLRLIDDFLLITTDAGHARRFLQTMHDGLPDYGVSVNHEKTLVNFEASTTGYKVRRLVNDLEFPYCGTFINTKSLHITKDRERYNGLATVDSLTVEYSKSPGKTFHRKVLNSFKIQCHAMFLDTAFNSPTVVARNIYESFVESANKMCAYIGCVPTQKQPSVDITIRTIGGLIDLAFVLIKGKEKNPKYSGYRCAISKAEVGWLAFQGFYNVLKPRQSRYQKVLLWLEEQLPELRKKRETV